MSIRDLKLFTKGTSSDLWASQTVPSIHRSVQKEFLPKPWQNGQNAWSHFSFWSISFLSWGVSYYRLSPLTSGPTWQLISSILFRTLYICISSFLIRFSTFLTNLVTEMISFMMLFLSPFSVLSQICLNVTNLVGVPKCWCKFSPTCIIP